MAGNGYLEDDGCSKEPLSGVEKEKVVIIVTTVLRLRREKNDNRKEIEREVCYRTSPPATLKKIYASTHREAHLPAMASMSAQYVPTPSSPLLLPIYAYLRNPIMLKRAKWTEVSAAIPIHPIRTSLSWCAAVRLVMPSCYARLAMFDSLVVRQTVA